MKRAVVLALAGGVLMASLLCGEAATTRPATIPATKPAEAMWSVDYADAMARAKKENKLVLLNFTGSDWCDPCKLLHARVFESPEFAQWAQEKLVLVEVDFPSQKKLPEKLAKQNSMLKWKHLAFGYPTVVIMDGEGILFGWNLGYTGEKAGDWIAGREKDIAAVRIARAKNQAALVKDPEGGLPGDN